MHHDEWKVIYDMYKKPLYLYALSLTGNTQDAEDLVQEAFVKAYLSYENTGSLKSWLVTVLRNEFYNLQRKRKKEVLDNGDILAQKNSSEDMLADLLYKEERLQLFKEIRNLPEQMKEILIESVYFQLKDTEISELHGITCENVRKIRSRAKQKLIERMGRESK